MTPGRPEPASRVARPPSRDPPNRPNPPYLRNFWGTPTTSCRVHDMTIHGRAWLVRSGHDTTSLYAECAIEAPNTPFPNPLESLLITETCQARPRGRLTAPAGRRNHRAPQGVVVVAPRPAPPLVETACTTCGHPVESGGLSWGRNGGFRPSGLVRAPDRLADPGGGLRDPRVGQSGLVRQITEIDAVFPRVGVAGRTTWR